MKSGTRFLLRIIYEGIRGFVVPTDTPGFQAVEIHKKLSLRASVTSELILDDVRLPADAMLPGVGGLTETVEKTVYVDMLGQSKSRNY